jgi:hypothetical protein
MSRESKKIKYSAGRLATLMSNHPDFLKCGEKGRKKLLKRIIKDLKGNSDKK